MAAELQSRIWLIRHGETEWSAAGRHTGRNDLPLNPEGERQAKRLRERLAGHAFVRVLTSPLRRARDTCALAGCGASAEVEPDLGEWDYGQYEGRTYAEITAEQRDWSLWRDGAPGGESPAQVAARVDRVLGGLQQRTGDVAVFAHGHVLRVFAARYLGWPAAEGQRLLLSTASISVLGLEHAKPVIERWNDTAPW